MTRWSGPFDTANSAGLWLTLFLCVIFAIYQWIVSAKNDFQKPYKFSWLLLYSLVCIAALCSLILLVLTQSRAALIALLVIIIWINIFRNTFRRQAVTICFAMLLIVGYYFFGRDRLLNVIGDTSIIDRLSLWRSTIELISDYPMTGVSLEEFNGLLEYWYLPSSLDGRFATPLNDAYAAGAFVGVLGMTLYCLVFSTLIALGTQMTRVGSHIAMLGTTGVIVFFVCGQFQCYLFANSIIYPLIFSVFSALILLSWKRQICNRLTVGTAAISGLVAVTLYLSPIPFISKDWESSYFHGQSIGRRTAGLQSPTRVLIAIRGREAPGGEIRRWVEHLRPSEVTFLALFQSPPSSQWLAALRASISGDIDIILLGHGEAGSQIIRALPRYRGLPVSACISDPPFDSLEAIVTLAKSVAPPPIRLVISKFALNRIEAAQVEGLPAVSIQERRAIFSAWWLDR